MVNIQNFVPRLYQETIIASCAKSNCLIILPTGMGKTKTAILGAVQRLRTYPNSKVLFLTVTKPLAEQIANEIENSTDIDPSNISLFTGTVPPAKRAQMWENAVAIISTPQCIENDIINRRISLENVSLMVVDEAHNAVKDYAYTWIASQYHKKSQYPRIIGLTASPGSDLEKIQEVCKNLYTEEIEIRTENDPDVKQYVHEVDLKWVEVNLSPMLLEASKFVNQFLKSRFEKLQSSGILSGKNLKYVSRTDMIRLGAELRGKAAQAGNDYTLWNGISIVAEIMKMQHALEMLETQGVVPFYRYMEKLNDDARSTKVKAVKNIVADLLFRSAYVKAEKMFEEKVEHPKLIELQKIITSHFKEDTNSKIIVFSQFRDSAADIIEKINAIKGVKANIFVGQAKKKDSGMTQKVQKQVLDDFREGNFNVLVATSIAEQGLDIPQVDTVIFYEPIPSAIRAIQRRGRTGRHGKGQVIILMTKGTMDEGYRWSSHHKERQMYRHLESLRSKLSLISKPKQTPLVAYEGQQKIKIYADHRESGSQTIKQLIELGADLKIEQLENADFVLSKRVGVEIKQVQDFVDSIIDGRLLSQLKNLKYNFDRPLIIIEGTEDIYSVRNVHANSIRGMLAAITVGYGTPILHTKNAKDTAAMLLLIARREQEETTSDFQVHAQKKALSIKEQQEYIISSLPGVGTGLAKPLLKEFGSVKNVVNASQKDLEKVDKIGKKIAEKIKEIIDREYQQL